MPVVINGTTGITNVNGSAAAPAETGTDTDTGIYYGTNTVGLATNGTNALFVDASQNVMVGGASPYGKITFAGGTTNASSLATSQSTSTLYIQPKSTSGYGLAFGSGPGDLPYIQQVTINGTASGDMLLQPYGGNVGIGTSSPAAKFAVSNGGAAGFEFSPTGGVNSGSYIQSYNRSGATYVHNTNYASGHTWYVGGTRAMDIDSSGNVGIGTTSTSGFRIAAVGAAGANAVYKLLSPSGYGSYLQMGVDGGSLFEISVNTSGNLSLTTNGVSADVVRITRAGSVSNTMTIDAGEVRVGNNTDQGAYNLQCNGTGVWGAGAYVNGSDARLKENIQTLTDGLSVVSQLRPVTFQYKADYSKDTSVQPGFIAQELQAALQGKDYVDGVVQAGPEYLNVAYQTLIPVLTAAIQELKTQNDELRARVAALEGAK